MRRTKFGWKPADLALVYRSKGFLLERGAKHDLFQHRRYLHLIATVRRSDPVKPGYIETLLDLLDEVERLEGSE
jgi:hypothetical protein